MPGAEIWTLIAMLTMATVIIKGTGPFLLGDHDLPDRLRPAVMLLPTTLMAALITVALMHRSDGTIGWNWLSVLGCWWLRSPCSAEHP
jgi:branched-subunit amino acid transport protein